MVWILLYEREIGQEADVVILWIHNGLMLTRLRNNQCAWEFNCMLGGFTPAIRINSHITRAFSNACDKLLLVYKYTILTWKLCRIQSRTPHNYRNTYCGIVSAQTKSFALALKRTNIPRFTCKYATTPKQNHNNCEYNSEYQEMPT